MAAWVVQVETQGFHGRLAQAVKVVWGGRSVEGWKASD